MSLRNVAATKSRAMHSRGRVAGTCNRDIQQGQNRSDLTHKKMGGDMSQGNVAMLLYYILVQPLVIESVLIVL